ncbi:MAG: integrin alpha [Planctomycetes bacterium]|nr:integrin alpha [Planctomycetota bacterium]
MQRNIRASVVTITGALALTATASAQSKIFHLPGAASGDAFGATLSRAGDVDGDGHCDLAIASTKGASGLGYVTVTSGLIGTPIRTSTGTVAGADFGAAVVGLGDIDGDGKGELAIGAPLASPNGVGSGRVEIFSGANGVQLYAIDGALAGDHFGFALAALNDVDGDGVSDLAIGAVDADPNGSSSGSVRVASGKTGATLYTVDGAAANELFGYVIASLGDQNADGKDDFVVGAPCANGVQKPGSARLVSGANGATLTTLVGWKNQDGYGTAVANAGDVDGDGQDDVIVGAPQTQAKLRGYIQVWKKAGTHLMWDIAGDSNGDAFGSSVASAGDPDGNGRADFAAGAPQDDDNGTDCGAVRVLSGISGQAIFTNYGSAANAKLGARLDGGFDANGDGTSDLLAGTPGEGGAGAATLISSRVLTLSTDVHTLSLGASGMQNLTLSADPFVCAGKSYTLLGSMHGITPSTTFGGMTLPLAHDRYFLYTTRVTKGPMKSARGALDVNGLATAVFDSKFLLKNPAFVGKTFFHAFAVTNAGGQAVLVSNAVPLTILP